MLPEVTLKSVSRDDVDRIAWWLQDDDLSSRWFGQYGADDPVHPGYDPRHMLEASDWEWRRTFADSRRAIFSIYSTADEHVGECQVQIDGEGGAELSVLIGRKDLWHHGYGTATMLELLDRVFNTMGLESAWVTVPIENRPAIGLFEKLGFVIASGDHVKHGEIDVAHMTVSSARYSAKDSRAHKEMEITPVVAVAGLPGSESQALGQEIARLLDSEYIGDEIKDLLSERLQCSRAELESFETSHKSFWMRLLASIVVPTEVTTAYESGYHAYVPSRPYEYDELLHEPLSKRQYVKKLRRIVRRRAAEGNAVLHGNGSHLFLPEQVDGLTVFVSASDESRAVRLAQYGDTPEASLKRLQRADKEQREIFRRLFDCEIDDSSKFDITVNLDRMTIADAAEVIVEVLRRRGTDRAPTPVPPKSVTVGS
ncbi:MAG: GNAT family N-acetyltransferase [Chloroflexota bacterium]|nr:GNAT family N-acetyltransferase [Chloroflexota bacterium]